MTFPSARVKKLARSAGFHVVRVSSASEMHAERVRYLDWLQEGRQAEMKWMTNEHAVRSTSPCSVLSGALSVISVGLGYWNGRRADTPSGHGRIARYAWGRDYHAVMGEMLQSFVRDLEREIGGSHRWYVDTGPLMDKALAARSGLGWYGKNTNILTQALGSWILLGEVITTLEIERDAPLHRDCGSCRLCHVACPTGALGPGYSIDSRKCISYLTIEHRGSIPVELRTAMSDWVFGCDICQDVCPPAMKPYLHSTADIRQWARDVRGEMETAGCSGAKVDGRGYTHEGSKKSQEIENLVRATPSFIETKSSENVNTAGDEHSLFGAGARQSVDLAWLLRLSHEDYLQAFRQSSIKRAKVWMLRRNAAIAIGNTGGPAMLAVLLTALKTDESAIVRGHAAWAIGRLAARHDIRVQEVLEEAARDESDQSVLCEIGDALTRLQASTTLPSAPTVGRLK